MPLKAEAAGEALTVKKVPHRPGTAPALGLRAGNSTRPTLRVGMPGVDAPRPSARRRASEELAPTETVGTRNAALLVVIGEFDGLLGKKRK
jgi:hypothetical protein